MVELRNSGKTCRTSANVCAKKSLQKFSQRTHPIIPLDPIMFRCISYNFGALGTVWLSYKTRCKTVVMVQKFVPRTRIGIFRNERTRSTHLILKNVLVHFIKFWCIWDHLVDLQNSMQNGPNWCKSSCHKRCRNFSQRMHPFHPIGP